MAIHFKGIDEMLIDLKNAQDDANRMLARQRETLARVDDLVKRADALILAGSVLSCISPKQA